MLEYRWKDMPVSYTHLMCIRDRDNTFTPLTDNLFVLTPRQQSNILQVAHLLPMMAGEVELQMCIRDRFIIEKIGKSKICRRYYMIPFLE